MEERRKSWWSQNALKVVSLAIILFGGLVGIVTTFNAYGDTIEFLETTVEDLEAQIDSLDEEQNETDVNMATIITLLTSIQKDLDGIQINLNSQGGD